MKHTGQYNDQCIGPAEDDMLTLSGNGTPGPRLCWPAKKATNQFVTD